MNKEDYTKYYIRNSEHYLIPKDVFIELFDEMTNWKKECKQLKTNRGKAIEYIKEHMHFYENNFVEPKFIDFDESARPKILIEILERGKE